MFDGGFTFWNFLVDAFVIFMFVVWLWLLVSVFGDLFRRSDISGGGKVIWVIFLIVLPYLGVFAYLLTQGGGMSDRSFAPWVERALTLVLPAIFAAIAVPMVLLADGTLQIMPAVPRLLAAMTTLGVAMRRRGYLLPLVLGMVVLHLAQWALRG